MTVKKYVLFFQIFHNPMTQAFITIGLFEVHMSHNEILRIKIL